MRLTAECSLQLNKVSKFYAVDRRIIFDGMDITTDDNNIIRAPLFVSAFLDSMFGVTKIT